AAAGDAADVGEVAQNRFDDDAGVIVEAAGDRRVELDPARGNACRGGGGDEFAELGDAPFAGGVAGHERRQLVEDRLVVAAERRHRDEGVALDVGRFGGAGEL